MTWRQEWDLFLAIPTVNPSFVYRCAEPNRSQVKPVNSLAHLFSECGAMTQSPIAKVLGGPTGHFPIEAEIVGYLANTWSVPTLLVAFAAGWAVILGATNTGVRRHNPALGSGDRAAILWFVLSTLKQLKAS